MHNLWQVFQNTVRRVPERAAIIKGDTQYTYSQWARRANDFRRAYLAAGVGSGDRVLLWMENSFDIAAALTAAWGNDAIPVLMDSGSRQPQLYHALETVNPAVIVFENSIPRIPPGSNSILIQSDQVPACCDDVALPLPRALPTDPASVVFTSGSTGKPKGVIQSHANLYRGCLAVSNYLRLRDVDSLLCPVPWSFDYGYGQLLTSIICGISHILPSVQNPFGICEAIEQHSPSVLAGTPSLYAYLMSGMSPVQSTNLSSLRLLTNTGGTLHQRTLSVLQDAFGNAELVLNYGLTETYRSCYLPPRFLKERPGSIGFSIPGVDIIVVREDGSLASPHEEGEIVHRGDYVFMGYWRNPEATALAIRTDPLLPKAVSHGARSLFTGDIGYYDDEGFLYFVGRRDQQLKSMGVRVSPGEVEEILCSSGLVEQAAVFGIQHDMLGHEVWAAIMPKPDDDFTQRDLEKYARAAMSQYMLPRRYLILEEMPRTTSGKVNYIELVEMASQLDGA